MTPLGWFFLLLSDAAALLAISIAWKASPPFDVRERWNRLARWWRYGWPVRERPARHGRHAAGRVYAAPLVLEQVTAHANANRQAAEEYLPAAPESYPWPDAKRPALVRPTMFASDATGSQQQLTPELEAQMRGEPTDEQTLEMYRAPDVTAWDVPVYGERPVADVLAAEAGAQMAEVYRP